MPQNIIETPSWDTPLTAPIGGDPRTSALMLSHLQKFANRLALLGGAVGISANYLLELPFSAPMLNLSSRFTLSTNDFWQQSDVTSAGELRFPISIPLFGIGLKAVNVVFTGTGGHAGLPGTMPRVQIKTVDIPLGTATAQTFTTQADQVDTSGTVAAYEKWHNVRCALPAVISPSATRKVYASILGETGGNSLVNGLLVAKVWLEVGLS
jgi:hypothetical protein